MNFSDPELGLIVDQFGLNLSTVDTIVDGQGEARITIAVLQSQLDVSILLRNVAVIS